MTTAARPTFDPAKGGTSRGEKSLSSLSKQYSSRDLPSHLKLKYRQTGQGTTDDLKSKDFRRELEERERLVALEKDGKRPGAANLAATAQLDNIAASSLNRAEASTSSLGGAAKKPRIEYQNLSQLDADEKLGDDDDDDEGNDYEDSDSDDDSEDDTAALLAELNRIKQERAAEEAKRDEERKLQENQIRMENILSGNPLLNAGSSKGGPSSFKVKRRWDDDVVFKNCAKGEGQNKRGFINDTLRSDFHRKFMEKYIK